MGAGIKIEVHFAELSVGVACVFFLVYDKFIFAVRRGNSLEAVCAYRIY